MGTPDTWGPPLWKELHEKTFNYPHYPTASDKKEVVIYFHTFTRRIPCPSCRQHYKSWLQLHPVENVHHMRKSLIEWLVDLHNDVNVRNGKRVWAYEEVYELYERKFNVSWIALAFFIMTLVILIRKR